MARLEPITLHDMAAPLFGPEGTLAQEMRSQHGALCYRFVRGRPRVLLVTSRTRRRWIIPKGWPIADNTPSGTAAVEAWEEAGVRGKAKDICIGLYTYLKRGEDGAPDLPCVITVYPLKVKSLASEYPEQKQRRRKWFSLKEAARKVAEPELRRIIESFAPQHLC